MDGRDLVWVNLGGFLKLQRALSVLEDQDEQAWEKFTLCLSELTSRFSKGSYDPTSTFEGFQRASNVVDVAIRAHYDGALVRNEVGKAANALGLPLTGFFF